MNRDRAASQIPLAWDRCSGAAVSLCALSAEASDCAAG
jgi:hypothetical protein